MKPRPGAADKTIVAGAQKAVVAEPPKSKSALWGAVAAVIVIGGGFGVYTYVNKQPENPGSQVAQSETATITPPTGATTTPQTTPPANDPPTQAQTTPAPVVPDPAPTKSAPVRDTPRQQTATPPRTPATQPTTQPTNPPATTPTTPSGSTSGAPAPAAGGPATLRLAITPGGNVFIDGVAKGETTRVTETLTPGEHLIRVEKAGFARKDTVVTLRAGETATVRLTLTPTP